MSASSSSAAGLRDRIIRAAGKLLLEGGYESLSMRRVAQEAGCSQMAMYRHFANKEALTQYICAQLYTRFAGEMNREIEAEADPWQRLRRFIAAVIQFASAYPDHYMLIFLVRHPDPEVAAERERLGQKFIAGIHPLVQAVSPPGTSATVIAARVRQMLACLHGTAGLLITHPRAYGLTKRKAVEDAEATVWSLLGHTLVSPSSHRFTPASSATGTEAAPVER